MVIREQRWHDRIHYTIIDGCAFVHLELYDEAQDFSGKSIIRALWIDPDSRRIGHAKRLLERAEHIAKAGGHKAIYLECPETDNSKEILQWYYRQGYSEQAFRGKGDFVLLKKSLVDIQQP